LRREEVKKSRWGEEQKNFGFGIADCGFKKERRAEEAQRLQRRMIRELLCLLVLKD